ncbi:MAG: DUF1501 domain-containing protein [Planctomyces sp.]|nr:DUF1501 domain-containing protein [Planctomyces sp.]
MHPKQNRRRWIGSLAASIAGVSASGWFPLFAQEQIEQAKRTSRHVILLWMSGGPSQTDTWDLKPGHANGGEFKEIQTAAPGLRFSEHLPKLAALGDKLGVIRGLSTREGDHGRGTYLMRTGHLPGSPVRYPCIGSSVANQLGAAPDGLPGCISVGAFRTFNEDAFSPGFLGPRLQPLMVGASDMPGATMNGADGFPQLRVQGMNRPERVTETRMEKRLTMWKNLQSGFLETHRTGAAKTHNMIYENAVRLMNSEDARAFDLSGEPPELREAYGRTVFGQGCLLARRLIEHGVSFIEVSLGTSSGGAGWDTHSDNFNAVRALSTELDNGWATLMTDLADRGLLESTTILWMGEFGRTPQINGSVGRDHFPNAWSAVLAGGGIAGGQAYGKTSESGVDVVDGMMTAEDLLATLCQASGIDPKKTQLDDNGRPTRITEGTAVTALLS